MKKTKNIIDFEQLEKPIKKIEQLINEYNTEEKSLIIKQLAQRIQAKIAKQRQTDLLQDTMKQPSLLRGLMKGLQKDEE